MHLNENDLAESTEIDLPLPNLSGMWRRYARSLFLSWIVPPQAYRTIKLPLNLDLVDNCLGYVAAASQTEDDSTMKDKARRSVSDYFSGHTAYFGPHIFKKHLTEVMGRLHCDEIKNLHSAQSEARALACHQALKGFRIEQPLSLSQGMLTENAFGVPVLRSTLVYTQCLHSRNYCLQAKCVIEQKVVVIICNTNCFQDGDSGSKPIACYQMPK